MIQRQENYQILETIGDCMIKFMTVLRTVFDYPQMSETELTTLIGRLVSNSRLASKA